MSTLLDHRAVLDHGFVELLDMMPREGSLIREVADTARVSYAEGTKRVREDLGLVEYLILNKHWSPFDQVKFKWRVRCPLFVRAQWYRHWSWDYNEESGRYSQVKEEWHLPSHLRLQDSKNRQATHELMPAEDADRLIAAMDLTMKANYAGYKVLLADGVAREQSRVVLPQSMYTTFRATCSLRQLIFFLDQRRDVHAQWEIRQYADAIHGMLLTRDVDLVNLLENYTWGARTMPGEVSRFLRLLVGNLSAAEVAGVAEANAVSLSKHELEWLEGWLKNGG